MPKLNPILPSLALLLCLLTACVTTPLHRFPVKVRNLGNEEIRDVQVRCGLANYITKPAMPQGHSHETTELKLLFLNEGACPWL